MSEDTASERMVRIDSRVGTLTAVLHRPPGTGGKPPRCVVGSHGLYSDRKSQKMVDLGRSLAGAGIAFLRYDCMGCGDSGGVFADTTLASRVIDLEEAMAWVRRQDDLVTDRVGLVGSSMGAFASLCLAAVDPGIAAVAAWAAPATFDELHDEKREQRRPDDEEADLFRPPALGPGFYRTLHTPDLVSLAPSLTNLLLLHGEKDETVPLAHALRLHRMAGEPKRLEIFPGGDHRFADPDARQRAVVLSTEWLADRLLD